MLPAVAPGPEALTQCPILVCDDSVGDATQLAGLLKNLGYAAVTPTTNSRRVMPMQSSGHFDLILLNIKMPHLGGLELIALIRQKYSAATLPILVITGANDYLDKPIDGMEMALRARNLLTINAIFKVSQARAKKI